MMIQKTKENIKWAALQPLTGGMYFGAEEAIGHPAEFILSYKGLNDIKKNKEDKIVGCGNEAHLLNYLKEHNRSVPYYRFKDRTMFQDDYHTDAAVVDENENDIDIIGTYKNKLDIVVSVPVCSGLSTVSTFDSSEREKRNCNMKWLAKYVIKELSPVIYIYENAPALFTAAGEPIRRWLSELAANNNYNIIFYKTDTQLHKNCQRRPRTFVFFVKKNSENDHAPLMNFVNEHISPVDFFKNIPHDVTLNTENWRYYGRIQFDFLKDYYGEKWREECKWATLADVIDKNNLHDDYIKFCSTYEKIEPKQREAAVKKAITFKERCRTGEGIFMFTPKMVRNHTPAIMFRTIENIVHPYEDRLTNIREAYELMGMPHDWEMIVDKQQPGKLVWQVGQNVPVKTAEYITSEAVRMITTWNSLDRASHTDVLMIDNIKQKVA